MVPYWVFMIVSSAIGCLSVNLYLKSNSNIEASIVSSEEISYIGPKYYKKPNKALPYKRTKTFNNETTPNALKNNHNTACNVWGVIHVEKGTVQYIVAPDEYHEEEQYFILSAGQRGLIRPQSFHRVSPVDDIPYEFYVEFNKE